MRNSAKYLLATAGICLLTAGHPAVRPIGVVFLGANDYLVDAVSGSR